MPLRRAAIARITTSTAYPVCLLIVVLASVFLANGPRVYAAAPTFLTNHQLYDRSEDIRSLQEILNAQGFVVAKNGPGSIGDETSIFGPHTYRALINFQSAHGLPATGYFGPLTRAMINLILSTSTPTQNVKSIVSASATSTIASTTLPFSTPLPGYAPGQLIFGGGTAPDIIPPTVSMTAPSSGATLSGSSVTLTATASDNVALASVQFKVDSSNVGSAVTVAPYTTSWNSTGVVELPRGMLK
jgi:peptidoglycan hydrolase-like protein with peptidoglycan-binding domain